MSKGFLSETMEWGNLVSGRRSARSAAKTGVDADGKRRRPHLFRAVLSHSRKGYCEVVTRQDTESFIRCVENAFRHFGGVTRTTVVDNLKAAVLQADWFDPNLNPKLAEFARFYGTAILPTQPARPEHKGKIEAGIKFAQPTR